jgi:hypothetical protein
MSVRVYECKRAHLLTFEARSPSPSSRSEKAPMVFLVTVSLRVMVFSRRRRESAMISAESKFLPL